MDWHMRKGKNESRQLVSNSYDSGKFNSINLFNFVNVQQM